ncbi:MAG: site-specific tyrosine recombinase XerD [Kiritimatiellia bacterium]|jgi:integrase/recombinase XerD|nr:site-specific tyrosine recombinase XerD [Kiritimatiellia bacterium]MDP6811398.1 site-specific tyrosine recombinase XerD [Kiritimatiellia bacterium]MDP7023806.1 site-specific tyrosine recombinase XerD [Kiritimatiellia bacterium]
MHALVEQFLDFICLERGLSANTRKAYLADLRSFTDYLAEKGISSFNNVKRDEILDYLMSERDRGLSVNSISRRLVAIKVFFTYLRQEGIMDGNVTEVMESPRLWRILPGVLTEREVERLLAVPVGTDRYALRDRAILECFYGTGMRVSELGDLRGGDIHFDSGYIRCRGKGNRVRVVPFGGKARTAVEHYLKEGRPEFVREGTDDHVFLTYRGGGFSRKGLWKLIKDCTRLAGITKTVSPHTLRHSFASHLLRNGAPLRVIQEMLGHADIGTTQIYTHIDQGRLRSVHAKFHPRA